MGDPEALLREQPYLEVPLTRRASGRIRAESSFPAREPEGSGRYRWRRVLTSAVDVVKSLDVVQALQRNANGSSLEKIGGIV